MKNKKFIFSFEYFLSLFALFRVLNGINKLSSMFSYLDLERRKIFLYQHFISTPTLVFAVFHFRTFPMLSFLLHRIFVFHIFFRFCFFCLFATFFRYSCLPEIYFTSHFTEEKQNNIYEKIQERYEESTNTDARKKKRYFVYFFSKIIHIKAKKQEKIARKKNY